MDILDFYAHDRREEYANGYYRENEKAEELYFEYSITGADTEEYNVISNLEAPRSVMTIRTTWNLGYKINGFVETQDGSAWQINAIRTIPNERNKQSVRLLRSNPSTAFELSLIGLAIPEERYE